MSQRLDPSMPVLLIWEPRLKPRWEMGSVSSLISGFIPLMCLNKPFLSQRIRVFYDEKGKKTNVKNPLTESQRKSGSFFLSL